MRKLIVLVYLLLLAIDNRAQLNSLANGGFEQKTTCSLGNGMIQYATGWSSATTASPDYYNTCGPSAWRVPQNELGYQQGLGTGYAGVINYTPNSSAAYVNYREYIMCQMIPMQVGKTYRVSMYVSLANYSAYATNGLGVLFYKDGYNMPTGFQNITTPPQVSYNSYGVITDTTNWVLLQKTFVADSPYANLIIGNFTDNNSVSLAQVIQNPTFPYVGFAYYYIDSVFVSLVTGELSISPLTTTSYCAGSPVTAAFTVNSPLFYAHDNVFTLQLSDATGSFVSPVNIGSLSGTTSGIINGMIPANTPTGTGYRLRIFSSNGIDSSMPNTIDVKIGNAPAKPVAMANTPLCSGYGYLNLSATCPTPGVTWKWTCGPSFTAYQQNPTIGPTLLASHSGNYIVEASMFGCFPQKDTVSVTVQETPAPITASSNSPLCAPNPLQLSATNTLPGATYHWSGVAGYSSSQQNPVITPSGAHHSGDYYVYASRNGCNSTIDTISVIVHPLPYLGAYASPNDTVCDGTVVTFVTVPMNGIVNPVFQWFKNGVAVPGQTNLTYIGAYTTGDKYYCRTYAQDLCNNNITLYSNEITMVVLPIVNNLSATISSTPVLALPGQPINFKCDVVSGGYMPQFQWRKNGQDIFGAIHANWSANNLAPYDEITCHVTSSDPCAAPTQTLSNKVIINFPAVVTDVNADNGISLYPNPNSGNFTIESKKHIERVEVLNSVGQKVYTVKVGSNRINISLPATLANGVYTLSISTEDGMTQQRITLQR
jgi:hypothetical protein